MDNTETYFENPVTQNVFPQYLNQIPLNCKNINEVIDDHNIHPTVLLHQILPDGHPRIDGVKMPFFVAHLCFNDEIDLIQGEGRVELKNFERQMVKNTLF